MTTADLAPSDALLAAARAERDRLERIAGELRERRLELMQELEHVEAHLVDLVAKRGRLNELLGEQDPIDDAPSPQSSAVDERVVRGAAIRGIAVRVALEGPDPYAPLHYRDWHEQIESAGFVVDGRDPAATLLTQLSRSPLVIRSPDSGTYQLDANALERRRRRLAELDAEAEERVTRAAQTGEDAIDLAQALSRLAGDRRRVERELDEALQTIHELDAAWFFGDRDRSAPGAASSASGALVAS